MTITDPTTTNTRPAVELDRYDMARRTLDRSHQATADFDQIERARITYTTGGDPIPATIYDIVVDVTAPGFWATVITTAADGTLEPVRRFIPWAQLLAFKVERTTAVHDDDQPF